MLAEVEAVVAAADPRFWLFLERARDWLFWHGSQEPARVEDGDTVPSLAVKALLADGRVRERAVDVLAASSSLAAVPVLVLRAADWVPQVRDKAREAIAGLLAADPDGAVLSTAAPMALALAGRLDGRWLADVVADRLAADPAGPIVDRLLGSSDIKLRRMAHQVLLDAGKFSLEQAVRIALTDRDVVIRSRCAERASRLAVDASAAPTMRRLVASRTPTVRVEALIALDCLDDVESLRAVLSDSSALVRGTARFYLRRRGVTEFADVHRRLIEADAVTPGAVAGLAEVGTGADAELLLPLLSHARARVRVETLRALIKLSAPVEAATLLDLIENDPSLAVTRQAAEAILHRGTAIDPDRLLGLLAPTRRAQTRVAAWQLLTSRDGAWCLAVNVMLLDDPDEAMAHRARAGLVAAMRQQLYVKPAGQAKDILAAHIAKADDVLPPGEVRLLYFITGIVRTPSPTADASRPRWRSAFRSRPGRTSPR
ncbi:hypothetical protein [Catenulispora sp. GP43]|uniref:hypothetical protein n=1 Tax=Catenulispora sp. GP43 TaxID=3156263 RepID=UPI0035111A9E